MYFKFLFPVLAVIVGKNFASGQQIPSSTTAAEMWNPWTWFWPYAIATAEGYRDYYEKAQKATNELYQQIYKTNAFPWVTGNWDPTQTNLGGIAGQNTQNGSGGQSGTETSQNNTGKAPQEGGTGQTEGKNDQNQPASEGAGAQVQGGAQDGGTGSQVQGGVQDNGNAAQVEAGAQDDNTGAQAQGSVQNDGTPNAEMNTNKRK